MDDKSNSARNGFDRSSTEIDDSLYVAGSDDNVPTGVKKTFGDTVATLKCQLKGGLVADELPTTDVLIVNSDDAMERGTFKRSLALSLGLISLGTVIGVMTLVRDRQRSKSLSTDIIVPAAPIYDTPIASSAFPANDTMTVHAEQFVIDTEPVPSAQVLITKEVVAEEQSFDVPVSHDVLFVERHPADDTTRASTAPIGAGEEIHIPLTEDQVNVQKQVVVTEEVAVGKRHVEGVEHISDTLRHEELRVDDTQSGSAATASDRNIL